MAEEVLAPMVGKVLKIKVKVGEYVKEIKVFVGDRVEEHQRINF